jgi:predicted HicB family RNase H-like nuclease
MTDSTHDFSDEDLRAARAKFAAKVDGRKAARKTRQKRLSASTDGRSLRASGRTEQFNFRSSPGLKKSAQNAAAGRGITLAEWMEEAVEAKIAAEAANV